MASQKNQLSELALAVRDPDRVRVLLEEGATVTAATLFTAILSRLYTPFEGYNATLQESKMHESLELLLASGADPNQRLDYANKTMKGVKEGWTHGNASTTRKFFNKEQEWYALQRAAYARHKEAEKPHLASLQTTLL
jgi:hypothetical protein